MTPYSLSIAIVVFAGISADVSGQTGPARYGDVTFELVFSQGGVQVSGLLDIYSSEGSNVYEEKVMGETTVHLPYGIYKARLSGSVFTPIVRDVTVDSKDTLVILAEPLRNFAFDAPATGPVEIRVQIRPVKSCSPAGVLWAKIVGVYSDYAAERRIAPDGLAVFDSIDDGAYVVMIAAASRLRAVESASTKMKVTNVEIALKDCSQ